jgi:serine/threonine protein kinase
VSTLLRIPARRETWFLLDCLGRGGEAETYRARRVSKFFSDEVCVKIPLFGLTPDERRSVQEEARVQSMVRHSNVVSLLDVIEDARGRLIIVLELVQGTSLFGLIRQCAPFDPRVAAAIARSLCLALGAAQRAVVGGMVHRDVTPHNVLVSVEGEIKLADFGIARALRREPWTRTGHVKGKCAYIAPEMVRGERCDVRSDVFSLGVLLYELLCGERPFSGPGFLGQLDAIAHGRYRRLAARGSDVPLELADLVDVMLADVPKARPNPDVAARLLARFADDQLAVDVLRELARSSRGPSLARTRGLRRTRSADSGR